MCDLQFFDQAVHMACYGSRILLGLFQASHQAEDRVVHTRYGKCGARFCCLNAARQRVERVVRRVCRWSAILERIRNFVWPGGIDRHK